MVRLPAPTKTKAYTSKILKPAPGDIVEIFSAIQGEGPLVGERQLFIRFAGCPYRCGYCDTPQALVSPPDCMVEDPPGRGKFRKVPNPIAKEQLIELVEPFLSKPTLHQAISITGGEPLWQAGYLKETLPALREKGRRIYLETAGTQCAELGMILEYVDVIAMDIKLPSSTGLKPMWALHRDFLRMSLAKQVIVKVVVTRKTPPGELELVRDMVSEIDRTLPVVLQPATPAWKVKSFPTIEQLMAWHSLLSEKLGQVRVIPQCQQLLGSR